MVLSARPLRPAAFGLALLLTACGGGGGGSSPAPAPAPVAKTLQSIALAPSAPSLNQGQTLDLTANATYSDGTVAAVDNASVWASSAPAVATVSAMGVVSALTPGTTTISASKDGKTGTATVTVTASAAALTSLSLDRTASTLTAGQSVDLTATAHWSDGTTTANYDGSAAWSSSQPAVATVNASGLVTAVSAGTATVTASASGQSATCTITVNAPAATLTSLTLTPSSGSLTTGQTLDIGATANWSDGTSTANYDGSCSWSSSNSAVATVNGSGLVTAVAAGSATITATAGGKSATCAIAVTTAAPTLTSLVMNLTSKGLTVGQTQELYVDAIWSNGTGTHPYSSGVTWTSSNPAVATITPGAFALATAVAPGTATITASAQGKSATCVLTVSAAAPTLSSLSLNATTAAGTVGQTMDLTATAHWSDGTTTSPYDASCTWTSSNGSVASVNGSGVVSAVGAGTATITASASGKSATCVVTITAPSFDSRLVGTWQWIGTPDANGANYGSFYHFYANGTFTYTLIYQGGSGCISFSQVVASHQGTYSSQGNLDNLASPGQIILSCTSHGTAYTACNGSVSNSPWTGANPHAHWAAFNDLNHLTTNHTDDFQPTGSLIHVRQ